MTKKTEMPTHLDVKRWVDSWQAATHDARSRSQKLRAYYHGNQWTGEQREELKRRGQPEVTINLLADEIDYVLGTEERNTIDPVAYPRTQKHDGNDDANMVTDVLRFVTDKEDYDTIRAACVFDMATAGYTGVMLQIDTVTKMHQGQLVAKQEIRLEHAPWDRLVWDEHGRKPDFSDGIWRGLLYWRDAEEIIANSAYKDAESLVGDALSAQPLTDMDTLTDDSPKEEVSGVWADPERNRVQVAEIYFRRPEKHPETGDVGDVWYRVDAVSSGFLLDPVRVEHVDEDGNTYCPLRMVSDLVTDEGERYSRLDRLISPQDEVNQRRSKSLHHLSQGGAYYERSAVKDPEAARRELMKPDMMLQLEDGALQESRFVPRDGVQLSSAHFQMMADAKGDLRTIGPHSGLLERNEAPGAESGRLFIAKKEDAGTKMVPFGKRLHVLDVQVFTAIWFMVRQYWTEERWFRVTDDEERKGWRFVGINRQMTRGQRFAELQEKGVEPKAAVDLAFRDAAPGVVAMAADMTKAVAEQAAQRQVQLTEEQVDETFAKAIMETPQAQEPVVVDPVAELEVDIIIETAPSSNIIQHEEFRELVSLAQSQMVQLPPAAILQASSLRNKKQLIESLEQSPEQAQQQQQQMQAQMAMMQAQLEKLAADIENTRADTAKTLAEAQAVPYEAQKDEAQALKAAAEAGVTVSPVEPAAEAAPNAAKPQGV